MEVKISLTAGRFNKTATTKQRTGLAYTIMSLQIGKFFLFFFICLLYQLSYFTLTFQTLPITNMSSIIVSALKNKRVIFLKKGELTAMPPFSHFLQLYNK